MSIVLTSVMPPAVGVVKAGSKCSKKNQAVLIGTNKFVCSSKNKKLVWKRVATKPIATPINTPLPQATILPPVSATMQPETRPTPNPSIPTNPILSKIISILKQLSLPAKTVAPTIEWVVYEMRNQERVESLKAQHQRLSDAFPTLYSWQQPALALVSENPTWLRTKLEEAGCDKNIIQNLRELEGSKDRGGAGTTVCKGRYTAYFLDRNLQDSNWLNIMASEFGGVIQENSYKKSPAYKSGNFDWYSNSPAWYAEGSQSILSVIAMAQTTRSWSHKGRSIDRISPYCKDDNLILFKCSTSTGELSLELAIALYGWEAPLKYFENISLPKNEAKIFETTFSDSFEKFHEWSLSYLKYLSEGTELPTDLVVRLTS